MTIALPVEAGCFEGDSNEHLALVRAEVSRRIQERRPIFPERAMGLEYAALNDQTPRGVPVSALALANLRVGEGFSLNGQRFTLVKRGAKLTFMAGETGKKFVTSPDASNWPQFRRDVDGLITASFHGVDAGDLLKAWQRDPVSRF